MGRTIAATLLLVAAGLPAAATAQWPMHSRSPARNAASENRADLGQVALDWRYYLGGAVAPNALVARDVDGDGRAEVLFGTGGRLVCQRDDSRIVWETDPLGLTSIVAVTDLNGDGFDEVVARGRPAVVAVFSLRDGELLWRTTRTTFGPVLGAVRLGQIVPGGPVEVYAADRMGSDARGRRDAMYAFRFSGGFGTGRPDNATQLWQASAGMNRTLPLPQNDVLADLDGDGAAEVVAFDEGTVHVYEAGTGAERGSYTIPPAANLTRMSRVVDITGDGDDEVLVAIGNVGRTGFSNGLSLFVLDWDAAGQRVVVSWSDQVPVAGTNTHLPVAASVGDLDGDGSTEVVTTFRVSGGLSTRVYRGTDGQLLASASGVQAEGIVDLGDQRVLLTRTETELRAYRWNGSALSEAGRFARSAAATTFVRNWAQQSNASSAPLTLSLGGTAGKRGLVTAAARELALFDLADPSAPVATFTPSGTLAVSSWAPQTNVGGTTAGLLVATSDGFLKVLDERLLPPNQREFAPRGLRIGGYYTGAFGLGQSAVGGPTASGPGLFIVDGQGDLIRLDVSEATLAQPPSATRLAQGAAFPLLTDGDGDGNYDEVVVQRGRGLEGFSLADGTSAFVVNNLASANEAFVGDHVPMRASGGLRYGVVMRSDTGQVRFRTTDRQGNLRSSTTTDDTGSLPGHAAVDDIDGDGNDDALITLMRLRAFFGTDLSLSVIDAQFRYPTMPIVLGEAQSSRINVVGAAASRVTGVLVPASLSGMGSLNPTWEFPSEWNAVRHFGTVLSCGTGASSRTLFATALGDTPQLGFVDIDAYTSGAPPSRVVLAQGQLFNNLTALDSADALPGAIGNLVSIADLDGTGRTAVLTGSTDGYLYAVDICSSPPSLAWALNFRAPVGEPVLVDTDGDQQEEIVVSVEDGFLYAVDREVIRNPAPVLDVSPDNLTGPDLDQTEAGGIAATWQSVVGATGYEWAVFTAGGTAVTRSPQDAGNPFIAVDASTTSAIYTQNLVEGEVYFFAVRTLGSEGASSEAFSDGTRFVVGPGNGGGGDADAGPGGGSPPGSGGDGGGCGCRMVATSRSLPAWALLAGAALLGWRRRRRAAR